MSSNPRSFDVALVGAGLQNGLIALTLFQRRPELRIACVEQAAQPGGNHTWCFHALDVDLDVLLVVEPLVEHAWPGYDVAFPNSSRRIDAGYSMVPSRRFAEVVMRAFQARPDCLLVTGCGAVTVGPRRVALEDGSALEATLVVDARGRGGAPERAGYQRFFGLEVEVAGDHGLERPVLMDATIEQTGGFRFMYSLPLAPRCILIEDTCFSRDPFLDKGGAQQAIASYASARGWRIQRVLRQESGVLPLPWSMELPDQTASPLVAGYRGGFFHPATGYSFPVALRLARHIADHAPANVFGPALDDLLAELRSQSFFAQKLNHLLFHLFEPDKMWNVFERFYKFPEDLLQRFYAMRLTAGDRARILMGRPPKGISWRAALGLRRSV